MKPWGGRDLGPLGWIEGASGLFFRRWAAVLGERRGPRRWARFVTGDRNRVWRLSGNEPGRHQAEQVVVGASG